ncbi:hypothetical protein PL373_16665 [Tenacibaculum maritimum]|nr:hypothetical protein [Tenacibaculum maritimum]MDB0602728.1 hypothetical protein [Tenacibaculum maritimum]MDB0612330.1 hypothetical protein [Tenacibaculum maritimum]
MSTTILPSLTNRYLAEMLQEELTVVCVDYVKIYSITDNFTLTASLNISTEFISCEVDDFNGGPVEISDKHFNMVATFLNEVLNKEVNSRDYFESDVDYEFFNQTLKLC